MSAPRKPTNFGFDQAVISRKGDLTVLKLTTAWGEAPEVITRRQFFRLQRSLQLPYGDTISLKGDLPAEFAAQIRSGTGNKAHFEAMRVRRLADNKLERRSPRVFAKFVTEIAAEIAALGGSLN